MAHMTRRKIICIILALIFSLSLFASGAFARVGCDEKHCKHQGMQGSQMKAMAHSTLERPDCCTGSQKDPCNLEKGQGLELHDCAFSQARTHKDGPSVLIVMRASLMFQNVTFGVFEAHPKAGTTVPSSSLYIKNASLIC